MIFHDKGGWGRSPKSDLAFSKSRYTGFCRVLLQHLDPSYSQIVRSLPFSAVSGWLGPYSGRRAPDYHHLGMGLYIVGYTVFCCCIFPLYTKYFSKVGAMFCSLEYGVSRFKVIFCLFVSSSHAHTHHKNHKIFNCVLRWAQSNPKT